MKIKKTKVKLDHTSGTAGAEVKDISTKKAKTSKFDLIMDLKGKDCGGVEHVRQTID